MTWFYEQGGEQRGPVSEADLENLVSSGTIPPETLVWREGLANWTRYSEAKRQFASAQTATPPGPNDVVCTECGRMFSPDEVVRIEGRPVCATCKPVFVQKLKEGAALSGTVEYGGFWIRFCAKFIDNLILIVPLVILGVVFAIFFLPNRPDDTSSLGSLDMVFGAAASPDALGVAIQLLIQAGFFLLNVIYQTFFLGRYGATPGKMACKLQVVTADGNKITYARALGRAFAEILSGLICNIGYIIAAFDGQKRALHDHICGTRVVKKQL